MNIQKKLKICELLSAHCAEELKLIEQASLAARDAAINEESQAEDSHDTRATEASYLARGVAQRAEEIRGLVTYFKNFPITEFNSKAGISVGTLVKLRISNREQNCFLCERGGGQKIKLDGEEIQALNVSTPLGEALVGARVGDVVEIESRDKILEYEVIEAT